MFRKLLILGSIAALFTIMTAAPAFGLAVETGPDDDKTVRVPMDNEVEDGEGGFISHNAHGPICGALNEGDKPCRNNNSKAGPVYPPGFADQGRPAGGANLGAWNSVFGPGGISNPNSAICGVVSC